CVRFPPRWARCRRSAWCPLDLGYLRASLARRAMVRWHYAAERKVSQTRSVDSEPLQPQGGEAVSRGRYGKRLSVAVLCAAGMAAGAARAAEGWTLVDLGTLGGPESHAAALSNSGIVAGCADTASGVHAFVYRDGTMRDLGTATDPPSGASCALAV